MQICLAKYLKSSKGVDCVGMTRVIGMCYDPAACVCLTVQIQNLSVWSNRPSGGVESTQMLLKQKERRRQSAGRGRAHMSERSGSPCTSTSSPIFSCTGRVDTVSNKRSGTFSRKYPGLQYALGHLPRAPCSMVCRHQPKLAVLTRPEQSAHLDVDGVLHVLVDLLLVLGLVDGALPQVLARLPDRCTTPTSMFSILRADSSRICLSFED